MLGIGAVTLVAAPLAWAHSGGTNADGCHTCRTNCARWGLSTGEYHCHRSGHHSDSIPDSPRVRPDSAPAGGTICIGPSKGSEIKIGPEVEGVVVVDGATFVARQGKELYLLRLRDIEVPQLEEPYGSAARDRLATGVVGRRVWVQAEKEPVCGGAVFVVAVRARTPEGEDLAEWLVSVGLARVSPEAPETLRRLEQQARTARQGLWRE